MKEIIHGQLDIQSTHGYSYRDLVPATMHKPIYCYVNNLHISKKRVIRELLL